MMADLADEPALSEELASLAERFDAEQAGPNLVLNFVRVSYINSSNLAQLLQLKKKLGEKGKQLKLCSVNDEIWSVMLVTGLDKVFRFAPDPMTALAGLQLEDEASSEAD